MRTHQHKHQLAVAELLVGQRSQLQQTPTSTCAKHRESSIETRTRRVEGRERHGGGGRGLGPEMTVHSARQ